MWIFLTSAVVSWGRCLTCWRQNANLGGTAWPRRKYLKDVFLSGNIYFSAFFAESAASFLFLFPFCNMKQRFLRLAAENNLWTSEGTKQNPMLIKTWKNENVNVLYLCAFHCFECEGGFPSQCKHPCALNDWWAKWILACGGFSPQTRTSTRCV